MLWRGFRLMRTKSAFSPLERGLIAAASLAVVVLFLKAAAPVVGPLLLAAFISVVAYPPLRWMQQKGMPKYLALGLVAFILLDVGSLIILALSGAFEGLRESMPVYQNRLLVLGEQIGKWLESVGFERSGKAVPDLLNPAAATRFVQSIIASLGSGLSTGLLVLLAVVFILMEAPAAMDKLHAAFNLSAASEDRLRRILDAVNRYIVIKSLASLATGLVVGIWLWLLNIDFAILWAMLAVLLNFIPFVGAVLMTIPAVLVALVQTDISTAFLVALGYLIANVGIGNVIEPKVMGRRLGLSEVALVVSIAFWGWVLGTIGVFLAVPMTMALMIMLEGSPQTRPFSDLLCSKVDLQRPPISSEP